MRPLYVRELQHAILSTGLESAGDFLDEDALIDTMSISELTAGLTVVDEESDVVRLAHYSVKEYLESNTSEFFSQSNNDITRSCIRYLSLATFAADPCPKSEIRDRMLKYPFVRYAAMYWVRHAGQNLQVLSDDVMREVVSFLADENLMSSWMQILVYIGHEEEEPFYFPMALAECRTPLEAGKTVAEELRLDEMFFRIVASRAQDD